MAAPKISNFKDHVKGDTFKGRSFEVLYNTVPLDLTSASIEMELKKNNKPDTVAVKTFSTADNSILITDATAGKFQIVKQIVDIPAFTYVYDIQIILQNLEVYTYISGTWTILQDITT